MLSSVALPENNGKANLKHASWLLALLYICYWYSRCSSCRGSHNLGETQSLDGRALEQSVDEEEAAIITVEKWRAAWGCRRLSVQAYGVLDPWLACYTSGILLRVFIHQVRSEHVSTRPKQQPDGHGRSWQAHMDTLKSTFSSVAVQCHGCMILVLVPEYHTTIWNRSVAAQFGRIWRGGEDDRGVPVSFEREIGLV